MQKPLKIYNSKTFCRLPLKLTIFPQKPVVNFILLKITKNQKKLATKYRCYLNTRFNGFGVEFVFDFVKIDVNNNK